MIIYKEDTQNLDENIKNKTSNSIKESVKKNPDFAKNYFSFNEDENEAFHDYKDRDDEKEDFYVDPVYNKAIVEYMNLKDRRTCRALRGLNEAGQNVVLTNLTSRLYDRIVEKCDDIDYGEIPNTKGDITKLSKYDSMKDTIAIMHDLLNEYKQDTSPIDELAVAFSNVEARKELFERAFRYNSELPIAIYDNVVMGIITGITFMISTCIEFIKDPGAENFRISLDKIAYAKTKDNLIYNTLKSFNKTCENKEFDKAMEAILKNSVKNFSGAAIVIGSIAIGIFGTIFVLIPILRELIFLFYYFRVKISDMFDIQADLLQMNIYNIEANSTLDKSKQKKVIARQTKIVNDFRKASQFFAIEMKRAEVAADKEKKNNEDKMLIDDIKSNSNDSSTSALF